MKSEVSPSVCFKKKTKEKTASFPSIPHSMLFFLFILFNKIGNDDDKFLFV